MKTIKFIFILSTMIIINSCTERNTLVDEPPILTEGGFYPFYLYLPLWFSVQDISGNDLVKLFGSDWWLDDSNPSGDTPLDNSVNTDLYTIEYVYPVPKMNPLYYLQEEIELINGVPTIIWDDQEPHFGVFKDEETYYFTFLAMSNKKYDDEVFPPADKIIFKLSCPSIFGDNEVYEIITYWEQLIIEDVPEQDYYKCNKIEFDGKEINFQRIPINAIGKNDSFCYSLATLILDKK